jgi:hypothetical protein
MVLIRNRGSRFRRASAICALLGLLLALVERHTTRAETLELGVQPASAGSDVAHRVAVDGSGTLYLAGSTDDALAGTNKGGLDAWVAAYDGLGAPLWIVHLGSPGDDVAYDIAVDDAGAVYVTGSTTDALGAQHEGGLDAWVANLDGNTGATIWVEQFGTVDDDAAYAIAAGASGQIYLAGGTDGALGGTRFGARDAFLACYDSNGSRLWLEQIGTRELDEARAVAVDAAEFVYVAGSTEGALVGPDENASRGAWLSQYE